jgi:CDP-diacylglycerol--serine O-phosphatidyltransferase
VARLTKQTSEFGKHLDSLSDAISFGIAPAFLVALMNKASETKDIWPKAVWFFCLVFALCSLLRLARYNVEAKPGKKETDSFKGLPTPAAAGMIAALVIFSDFLHKLPGEDLGRHILSQPMADRLAGLVVFPLLPAVTLIVGSLMVSSRIFYPHLVNRYISGKRTFEFFVSLIVIVFLAFAMREITLVVGFGAYVVSGPVAFLLKERKRRAELKDIALRS